jgi:hypothetical protein
MELIATDNEAPVQEIHTSIREMIKKGYIENEAAEAHTAKVSFPRIPQLKWPSTRVDGRSGHHYHLTQVPSDIEVNIQTGFALVYHILLNFEKPTTIYNSQEITDMTKARFQKMDIELGELCEPIAPLCNSKNDAWNGLTRVHFKNLELDGNACLKAPISLPWSWTKRQQSQKYPGALTPLLSMTNLHSKFQVSLWPMYLLTNCSN